MCRTLVERSADIRLSIRGAPVYDKHLNQLQGSKLLKVKQAALKKYPDIPERLLIRLLVGQESLPCCSPDSSNCNAPTITQTMMVVKLLRQGGNFELLESLWGYFCESALHTATLSSLDWSSKRVFVC